MQPPARQARPPTESTGQASSGLHPAVDGGLSHQVSADLERIFQAAAPAPSDAPARGGFVQSFVPGRGGSRRTSPATIGAILAAGLAGLSAGSVLMNGSNDAPVAAPRVLRPGVDWQIPTLAPPAQPTSPFGTITPPPLAPNDEASGADFARLVRLAEAEAETSAPARKASARKPAKDASTRSDARVAPAKCRDLRGGALERCAYPAVMDADRRLRKAYSRARRAGVPRSELVAYRERWAGLRDRSEDAPSRLIHRYEAMADDLTRLAERARERRRS